MTVPYAGATSGAKARDDIIKILRIFGCESVGFMDEFETKTLILQFTHRGKNVQLKASAQGWATAYLQENPWTDRRRLTEFEWEERALRQGTIAVNSILRDWIKGQVTAMETGILTFNHIFMPHMLADDGRTMLEHVEETMLKIEGPEE